LRYAALCLRNQTEHLDLLVLDVGVTNPAVLRGMAGALAWPSLICVKHAHVGLQQIYSILVPAGYALASVALNNPTPY
jgi:hypothetical protein